MLFGHGSETDAWSLATLERNVIQRKEEEDRRRRGHWPEEEHEEFEELIS